MTIDIDAMPSKEKQHHCLRRLSDSLSHLLLEGLECIGNLYRCCILKMGHIKSKIAKLPRHFSCICSGIA